MRVLVTGHHGYIGSVLAPMLQDAGHDVVGLDTFFYRGCDFGEAEELSPRSRGTFVTSLPPSSRASTQSCTSPPSRTTPSGTSTRIGPIRSIATGRLHWRALPRAAGVERFVFASSCSMYGAVDGDTPVDEGAALRPLTPYAESKVAAEEALRELAGDGFSPVSMRNATVVRRLTASAARHRAQQSRRVGAHDGCDQAVERRHILAPPRSHPRRRARHRWPSSTLPPALWRERRSTSAAPSRTTGSATWRRSVQAAAARLRDYVRRRRLTRPAQLPRRLLQVRRRRSPTAASSGRRSEASTSSLTRIPGRT